MRIIVCGSRTFSDRAVINTVLNGLWWPTADALAPDPKLLTLIEGGAAGADSVAGEWAERMPGVRHERVPADWHKHGRAAGPIRNQKMLDTHGHIDLVIAFVNKSLERSKGTFGMVRLARQASVPVWVIEVQPSRPPLPPSRETMLGYHDS